MIAISTCLLGINCRYDGNDNGVTDIIEKFKSRGILPICPEQIGGLPTPRPPAEITSWTPLRVSTEEGEDVTQAFVYGGKASLDLALMAGCKYAILKAKSPSCGSEMVYDGTFTRRKITGKGVTAQLFEASGIKVFNEDNYNKLIELLGE